MENKIIVIHSDGTEEAFKPRLISQTIQQETGLNEEIANKAQSSIAQKIYRLKREDGLNRISTSSIRAEVSSYLLKVGEFEAEEKNRKLGMSVKEFENLMEYGCNDNANIGYSPEMITKYAYDSIAKEYALLDMPEHCAQAHIDGFVHHHDLEFFHTRPNCLSGNNNIIIKDEDNNISYTTIKEFVEEMFLSDKTYYVPSLNIETNSMEWKRIENAYLSSPSEETYLVTFSKGYSIECTSDHKFVKSHNNKPQKEYNIKVSEFDNYKDLRLCNITDLKENNDLHDYNKSALFGFFLGDGYISNKGNVKFSFSKKDKAEYLYALLERLNIDFTYTEKESNHYDTGCLYSFYIKDKIYPQLSKSKLIKKYTSKYNLTGILEGLINSDGHVRLDINNILRLNFTNTNKSIFDLYQLCLISNGIRGSINITEFNNPNHKDAYNSSSFGEKLLSLLSSINICNRFVPIIEKANPNMKKYTEISELKVKSIEYTGVQAVYNLTIEDNHNYLAGINGFVLTQNCMNYDLRFFAKNGLMIDGKGLMGSVAKPAKTLEVLLNHLLQAFMAGAVVFSGGQGYVNFNTLLAPFARGRTYEEIKQAIQGFIFNCNMSLVCRGGQILFSSIGVDLSIPDVLKNEPAIGPNGVANGVYGDYQEEADLIFRAILEVSEEKDGAGAYHRFPNILFNIREGDLDEYSGNCQLLHEKGANNPTLYYVNCTEMERTVMGALSSDTPVMTDKGFKYPQVLSVGDNVMTYTKDGKKEWQPIEHIIPKKAPDKIYQITLDNNYVFKVTNNHKLPTNNGIVKSENLKVGMELYNYIEEPYIPTNDYEMEFIGVFLADGYIRDNKRNLKNSKAIEFHVKQKWKLNAIIDLCNKCNYKYEIQHKKDKTFSVFVREEALRDNLELLYDKHGIKHFPMEFWHDKNALSNIIKGLMFDGRKGSKYRWDWSCSDLPLVIDVMYALSLLGRTTTLYVDDRNGSTGNWRTNYRVSFGLNYKPKNKTKIKSIELVDNNDIVYDLSIKSNHNYVCGLGGIHSENCRTALPVNYTGDYEKDSMNTGNFMYSTLNLPLIALEANGDKNKFYDLLNDMCNIIYDTLIYRRECVKDSIYNKHMSDFLLQKDKETGEPLWDIDRTTISIGYCGLYECLQILNSEDEGEYILNYINTKKEEFNLKDGLRWSVIGSPAESASHRFAEIIKEKYPHAPVQGVKGSYYLTNSSHIPVSQETNIIDHIRNADKYHPLSLGGNILHIWLGEVWSNAEALWSLNKKILETGTVFWAYSKVFTFCPECGYTINDNLEVCPICGSTHLFVYDRITGYYLCIETFNDGKRQEFKDRYRQKL